MSFLGALGLAEGLSAIPFVPYMMVTVFIGVFLLNLKGIPGFWHVRLFKGVATQLFQAKWPNSHSDNGNVLGSRNIGVMPVTPAQPNNVPKLFSYLITMHRNPPIECDFNMHKSNSTFFSDLDINRTQLLLNIFRGFPRWAAEEDVALASAGEESSCVDKKSTLRKGARKEKLLGIALGGVSCTFKREIKPLQRYDIWSRVLTWDEKWLYIVSYFVKEGTGKAVMRSLSTGVSGLGSNFSAGDYIFASCLSRYVLKDGRRTIKPENVLVYMALYPAAKAEASKEEEDKEDRAEDCTAIFAAQKQRGLEVVRSFHELDALPLHFGDTASSVLGRYMDL
ncbi:hypothetical protein McanMca71_002975 [Microsporum canis]|uniref:Capsule polysaccharide biosynthesis protein n=1 Tax=Arthroderma otae (strain ATCC MYA-4605 / CBS 113480) TaxID=554155 RepID=C5G0G6_ARTOC|nr:conserved hypothetical protein [Microsporum canis CBS 113480]EEQ35619.1 conserved hypothetical protein [Microsporum canis CBS 113480]